MHTKGESSILDFIVVVENRSGKETELHVFSADVGTTDHCLIPGMDRQPTDKSYQTKTRWENTQVEN